MRRLLIAAAATLCLAATAPAARAQMHATVLSDADQAVIVQIESYLNGLTTLQSRFLQTGDDGSSVQGSAWLARPGRMRFEYDKPSPLLLVAGHGLVVFHDASLDQTSNIPLSQSPLGVLLGDHIVLHGEITVTDFQRLPGQYTVTLVRTKSPGDGTLTLNLNADPLALTGWSVVDAQGRETRVRLSKIALGGSFPDSLFTYIDPKFFDQSSSP